MLKNTWVFRSKKQNNNLIETHCAISQMSKNLFEDSINESRMSVEMVYKHSVIDCMK